ncbi:MAG: tetratricopeptide repeat protein [Ferruginibacter sp.]
MAETKTATAAVETHEPVDQAKNFWDKYSKPVLYVVGAIAVLTVAWYAYKNFVLEPKKVEANEAFFAAEGLFDKMASTSFNKDSINIVMNGGEIDGQKVTGALKVISNFGSTPAGDRAKYVAGACYLHLNEFDKAIKYLEDFDGNGATQVQSKAYIMLGHAYAEKKKTAEALSNYKKAASVNEKDEFFAPDALLMAAAYATSIGDSKEAISLYQKVKEKYPSNAAVQSGDVDKNLARLGVLN